MAKDFLIFLEKLNDEGVEFVIVGGVAARLYGSTRLTHDVDVVPNLTPHSWRKTVECIWEMGGRPRIPESMESIADVRNVQTWITEKGMQALNFRSEDGYVEIDLLVAESGRFNSLKERATAVEFRGKTYLIAAVDDLIAMKRAAGRPQDLLDIQELEEIRKRTNNSSG
jgi:predicted nucleotidyltransferase